MKNLLSKFSIFAFVLSLGFLTTSCDPDPVIDPIGPSISFVTEAGVLDTDTDLFAGETFSVKISLTKGDADLSAVTVWDGGAKLDDFTLADASGNAIDPANNPFTLQSGNEYTITIVASSEVGSTTTYAFEVSDQGSLSAETSIAITIVAPATTDLNVAYSTVVLNNYSGPDFGSLDLDTGDAVSSSSDAGDIRDRGIDSALPADQNWIQKIHPVNGAKMRAPDFAAIEDFSFDTVDSREALEAAYDTAVDIDETDVLAEGDMFMTLIGEDYYLVKVTSISVTSGDNTDSYTLEVKGSKKD